MNSSILVGSSKVSTKGQITIPEEIRTEHQINPGDTIYFIEEDGKILIKKGPIRLPREL